MKPTIEQLEAFVKALEQRIHKKHYERFTIQPDFYRLDYGRKNAKIVRFRKEADGTQTNASVYGFINLANGDLYKAASWKAPAKHPRGNILNINDPFKGCGQYGMEYLR